MDRTAMRRGRGDRREEMSDGVAMPPPSCRCQPHAGPLAQPIGSLAHSRGKGYPAGRPPDAQVSETPTYGSPVTKVTTRRVTDTAWSA